MISGYGLAFGEGRLMGSAIAFPWGRTCLYDEHSRRTAGLLLAEQRGSTRRVSWVFLCCRSVSESHVRSTGCSLAPKHAFGTAKREGSVLGRHQELLGSWLDLLLPPKRLSPLLLGVFVVLLATPQKGNHLPQGWESLPSPLLFGHLQRFFVSCRVR